MKPDQVRESAITEKERDIAPLVRMIETTPVVPIEIDSGFREDAFIRRHPPETQ